MRQTFFFGAVLLCVSISLPDAWSMGKRPPVQQETLMSSAKPVPLTMEECYQLALKRSETVAIQREAIKEAEAQLFKAASQALGQVDFIMTDFRQEDVVGGDSSSVASSFTKPERRERELVITQPLFQGFKAVAALTGAGSLKQEQKEDWLRAKQLLFLGVVKAYYGLLQEKKDLETIEGIHSLFQERIKELTEREQIGRSRTSEVVTAQSRMKILEAERSRVHGLFAVAQHLLEFLIGIPLEARELQEDSLPEEIPHLTHYLESAETRPDVEAARQAVKTAWRGVIVAQSELWPEISLQHNRYDRREGLQSNIDWDLLFKVDVPLFRGGGTVGKIKEAVSRWKKQKLAYSLAKRKGELEIKQSYQNWASSSDESKALEEAVKASEENFRLQKDDYTHNLVSNLDVLQALESLHQTRRDANRTHYQMKENYWTLRIALGEIP